MNVSNICVFIVIILKKWPKWTMMVSPDSSHVKHLFLVQPQTFSLVRTFRRFINKKKSVEYVWFA